MTLPHGYPLAWPDGWARTQPGNREASAYKVTASAARDDLERELRLFGVSVLVITTNLPLRLDGRPLTSKSEPGDPGVSVWWSDPKNGRTRVIACDAWRSVRENLRAIGITIQSMRAMDRSRASQALERIVESFTASSLPAPRPHWAEVLDVRAPYSVAQIEAAYKAQALRRHPDQGGTAAQFIELQQAREAALRHVPPARNRDSG
jgi:hypothetical protein